MAFRQMRRRKQQQRNTNVSGNAEKREIFNGNYNTEKEYSRDFTLFANNNHQNFCSVHETQATYQKTPANFKSQANFFGTQTAKHNEYRKIEQDEMQRKNNQNNQIPPLEEIIGLAQDLDSNTTDAQERVKEFIIKFSEFVTERPKNIQVALGSEDLDDLCDIGNDVINKKGNFNEAIYKQRDGILSEIEKSLQTKKQLHI